MAVASITDTEPQQEQQECQNTNTMNVTIQEQYNSTTQTTNHEETKVETTKPDANLKQIIDFMKLLSEKVDKTENQTDSASPFPFSQNLGYLPPFNVEPIYATH